MSDKFNINNVEKFINSTSVLDNSHIGLIIQNILQYRTENRTNVLKYKVPYSIEDKIDLNKIASTLENLIVSSWADHFFIVDFSINNIAGVTSSSIIDEVYEFYKMKYIESLLDLDIDISDEFSIKNNSTKLFLGINVKVKEIFDGKEIFFSTEQLDIYVFAITVYVFYKCKILVPIREE